jgi:hypothetical protein
LIELLSRLFGKRRRRRRVVRRRHSRSTRLVSREIAADSVAEMDFDIPRTEPVSLSATPIKVKGTFGRNATDPLKPKRH